MVQQELSQLFGEHARLAAEYDAWKAATADALEKRRRLLAAWDSIHDVLRNAKGKLPAWREEDPESLQEWLSSLADQICIFGNLANESGFSGAVEALRGDDDDVEGRIALSMLRLALTASSAALLSEIEGRPLGWLRFLWTFDVYWIIGDEPSLEFVPSFPNAQPSRPERSPEPPTPAPAATPKLVTIADVALVVKRDRKSMTPYVKNWPQPAYPSAGSKPAQWNAADIHPILIEQFQTPALRSEIDKLLL